MKILIISQHIFPMQTPRAHRTTELVKEFARQGHEVTVYAVLGKYDYTDFEVEYGVKVKNIKLKWQLHPYNSDGDSKRLLIDRILSKLFGYLFEFPNIEFTYRLKRCLKNDLDYDAVISIADPHHIHWGIARLKESNIAKFPKKWIADCGDPFMSNNLTKEHRHVFESKERKFCLHCDHITVPHSGAIDAYYLEYKHKIKIIPQGFNFDVPIKVFETDNLVPTFAYAGTFLKDIRNPETFFNLLLEIKTDFKFYVYTSYTDLIDKYTQLLGEKLVVLKPIPRNLLVTKLRQMDFLINIENLNTPTAIPSKLIDYAITGRPILSFNQENINKEMILKFLNKNYSNSYIVKNIEQYHISSVADQFIALISN